MLTQRCIWTGCFMDLKQLYLEIYRSDLKEIIRFMLLVLLAWTVAAWLLGSLRLTRRGWMWLNRILAGCAIVGILSITVILRFRNDGNETGVFLIPFRVPAEAWRAEEYYRMLVMNAFLYFPLGLSLANAWSPARRAPACYGLTVLCGAGLSLLCESLQGIFALGTMETDDLLLNTAGVALGALSVLAAGGLSALLRRVFRRRAG